LKKFFRQCLQDSNFTFVEKAQIAYKFNALPIEKKQYKNMQESSFYHIIKA